MNMSIDQSIHLAKIFLDDEMQLSKIQKNLFSLCF